MTEELEHLLLLMRSANVPLTAAEIAAKTNTYVATVKRRIDKLKELGHEIKTSKKRVGARGFMSTAWRLVNHET